MRILALSGSLRTGSSNIALLHAAKEIAAPFASVEVFEGLGDLPYFNPDLDRDDPPSAIIAFREAVAAADALLISTPEYAHGIPGVLKNALDWLVSDTNFAGKRVGVLFGSASDSSFARAALVEVLNTKSAQVVSDAIVSIPGARVKVSADGRLQDRQTSDEVLRVMKALKGATT